MLAAFSVVPKKHGGAGRQTKLTNQKYGMMSQDQIKKAGSLHEIRSTPKVADIIKDRIKVLSPGDQEKLIEKSQNLRKLISGTSRPRYNARST